MHWGMLEITVTSSALFPHTDMTFKRHAFVTKKTVILSVAVAYL